MSSFTTFETKPPQILIPPPNPTVQFTTHTHTYIYIYIYIKTTLHSFKYAQDKYVKEWVCSDQFASMSWLRTGRRFRTMVDLSGKECFHHIHNTLIRSRQAGRTSRTAHVQTSECIMPRLTHDFTFPFRSRSQSRSQSLFCFAIRYLDPSRSCILNEEVKQVCFQAEVTYISMLSRMNEIL